MNWVMRMLQHRRLPETRFDDENVERDKLRRAQLRLKLLDIQADIIARRHGKIHDSETR